MAPRSLAFPYFFPPRFFALTGSSALAASTGARAGAGVALAAVVVEETGARPAAASCSLFSLCRMATLASTPLTSRFALVRIQITKTMNSAWKIVPKLSYAKSSAHETVFSPGGGTGTWLAGEGVEEVQGTNQRARR